MSAFVLQDKVQQPRQRLYVPQNQKDLLSGPLQKKRLLTHVLSDDPFLKQPRQAMCKFFLYFHLSGTAT